MFRDHHGTRGDTEQRRLVTLRDRPSIATGAPVFADQALSRPGVTSRTPRDRDRHIG